MKEISDEHVLGAIRLDQGNFISKHWHDRHKENKDPPVFLFKVNKVHKAPLSYEVDEAVKI